MAAFSSTAFSTSAFSTTAFDFDSVTPPVVVVVDQPTGGWFTFLNTYEHRLAKRREEQRKRQELEEETEQIEDSTDRQIAQLIRIQEAKDAKRQELEQTAQLAKANADITAARQYSEKVGKALEIALQTQSLKAIARFEKELRKAREDEEALLMMLLLDE